MHHRTIEQLAAGQSQIHRLDPRIKLAACLIFVVVVAVLPRHPLQAYLLPALMVLSGLAAARLPFGFVASRTLMVLPFVLLVALFLPFTRGSTILWTWESTGLVVYREGLFLCITILIKGILAILAVGWLVFTTPFNRLLVAMRLLRVPRVIVVTLAFLFRYLDLLADQSLRVRRARSARTPGGTRRWRWRSTGGMLGRLLLRALDRADRVHRAMISRGFDGEVRVLTTMQVGGIDILFLIAVLVLLGTAVVFGHLAGGV